MDDLKGKVRYLQGLAEGMKLGEKDEVGKIVIDILEVLAQLSVQVEENAAEIQLLNFLYDQMAQESELFDERMENFRTRLLMLEGGYMDISGLPAELDLDDFFYGDEEDEDLYEVKCPKCGQVYYADFEAFDEDNVVCPNCDEPYHLSEEVLNKLIGDDGDHHE